MSQRWKFSNFRICPILEDGIEYPSVENYYQAHKTSSKEKRKEVMFLTPSEAKRWAQALPLPADWDAQKEKVMLNALWVRYNREPFKSELLSAPVGDLIEWNYWHDNYWGICTCAKCDGKKGKNRLGELLKQIKADLT